MNIAIVTLFFGWYAFNFLSNTSSKSALQNVGPATLTFVQMFIGFLGCFFVLLFKKSPNVFKITSTLKSENAVSFLPLAMVHLLGNLCTNYGTYHATVSYVQIVKVNLRSFNCLN
jgi:hypothetical protein